MSDVIARFPRWFSLLLVAWLACTGAERAAGQAVNTGQYAAIYRGTATYTVTSYNTGVPATMPLRFKFVDTFYFIQYTTAADYTNSNGTGVIQPLTDPNFPNHTTAAGDPAATMNHYSLIYFTTAQHPYTKNITHSPNGDFDLGYDCPFVGVNAPGSGGDLTDLYHLTVGPNSYQANVPTDKAVQPGATHVMLPIFNDRSRNDIGSGNVSRTPDGKPDNVRTQTMTLIGMIAAKPKNLPGAAPRTTYGGGNVPLPLAAPAGPAGAAFAPDKYTGLYNALSIFNGGTTNAILRNPYRDPFDLGIPDVDAQDDVAGATVTTITGKWDLKLDTKLTGFANSNTRVMNAAAVTIYVNSGRTGAAAAVTANTTANANAGFTGDGSQYAAEAVVFEALLGGTKPKAFLPSGAVSFALTNFNGNVPNKLATVLF